MQQPGWWPSHGEGGGEAEGAGQQPGCGEGRRCRARVSCFVSTLNSPFKNKQQKRKRATLPGDGVTAVPSLDPEAPEPWLSCLEGVSSSGGCSWSGHEAMRPTQMLGPGLLLIPLQPCGKQSLCPTGKLRSEVEPGGSWTPGLLGEAWLVASGQFLEVLSGWGGRGNWHGQAGTPCLGTPGPGSVPAPCLTPLSGAEAVACCPGCPVWWQRPPPCLPCLPCSPQLGLGLLWPSSACRGPPTLCTAVFSFAFERAFL